MTMPRRFVLVRHGESEGNVAVKSSEKGNNEYYTEAFRKRPSRHWCLTDRGRGQAKVTGEWLHREFPDGFGRRYVSETTRTYTTAGLLAVPGPKWYSEADLIERNWGHFDGLTEDERRIEYGRIVERKDIDPFMWAPDGGESLHSVRKRLKNVLGTLHRECSDMDVIAVCHGEVMWCFRTLIERMTIKQFTKYDGSKNPKDRINNCQVMVYSRIDPVTGDEHPHNRWLLSICPHNPELSRNEWQLIERPRFTDEDLLAEAALVPQLIH